MTFVIPVYQRNYDWNSGSCKQLIIDIESIVNNKENHFIGTVCIKPDGRHASIIIDGQQRITTLLLILKAIHDLSDDKQLKRKISTRFLINEFSDEQSKLRLKPIKKDEGVFKKLLGNTDFDEDLFSETEKLSNVYNNYILLKGIIKKALLSNKYSCDDIEDAVERLEVVELELEDENPQIIFESLNSKGQDLQCSDLLRNYLLMSLNYEFQEKLYNNYWRVMEEYLNNDNKILEDFMTYFLITKKKSDNIVYEGKKAKISSQDRDKLYQAFKYEYPNINRNNIVEVENCFKELLQYAKYYSHFIFDESTVRENLPGVQQLFYDLVYSLGCKDSSIVLMYLYNKFSLKEIDVQTFAKAVKALISLSVRADVCDKQGLSKQFSASVIKNMDNVSSGSFMERFWDALTMGSGSYKFPNNNEFKFSLESIPFYTYLKSRKTKYILYSLNKKLNPNEVPNYLDGTIEHIMPQTLSVEWQKYLSSKNDLDNYESHLHKLGNLCLTGYNSELSNDSFDKKVGIYKNSNYSDTRNICIYTDWTSKEIDLRTNELIDYCISIWKLPDKYNNRVGAMVGVEYNLDSDFTLFKSTKPLEVKFFGDSTIVANWYDLLISVLTDCYNLDKQLFTSLVTLFGASSTKIYFSKSKLNMKRPIEVSDSGIFVETNNSALDTLKLIEKVLEYYDGKLGGDLRNDLIFTLSKV